MGKAVRGNAREARRRRSPATACGAVPRLARKLPRGLPLPIARELGRPPRRAAAPSRAFASGRPSRLARSRALGFSRRFSSAAIPVFVAVLAAALALTGCAAAPAGSTGRAGSSSAIATVRDSAGSSARAAGSVPAPWLAGARDAVAQVTAPYGDAVSVVCVPLSAVSADGTWNAADAVEQGADTRRTSASMIKLAVLACALDQAASGSLSLTETLTVQPVDVVGGTGVLQGGGAGASYQVGDLLRVMITDSDNIATNLVIGRVGMDAVNAEAARLGLAQTSLERLMMDTAAQAAGRENRTSARDVASLLARAATGSLVNPDMSALAMGYLRDQHDTQGIAQGVPAGTEVAHKTGSLAGAQHDGAVVYGPDPYVLVVMTEGLSNAQGVEVERAVSAAVWAVAGA